MATEARLTHYGWTLTRHIGDAWLFPYSWSDNGIGRTPSELPRPEPWLLVDEAAKAAGVKEQQIRTWIEWHRITINRHGMRVLVRLSEVVRCKEGQRYGGV